jgi:hypothetical protein
MFPSNMDPESYRAYHREQAGMWKRVNANRAALGLLSFDGVLMEEVEEMLAETPGSPEFRAEAIQVSAVAALIVEAHDRRVAGEQEKAS